MEISHGGETSDSLAGQAGGDRGFGAQFPFTRAPGFRTTPRGFPFRSRERGSGRYPGMLRARGQLGTTDDCGFAPFADDTSTSRDIAFAKIRARVEGTRLASQQLQV